MMGTLTKMIMKMTTIREWEVIIARSQSCLCIAIRVIMSCRKSRVRSDIIRRPTIVVAVKTVVVLVAVEAAAAVVVEVAGDVSLSTPTPY
ncbi:Uncharacterised protein [Corynebacterium matruchotii]|uniref:Uncharacterized protein n=1 Tax=Corynebacterium matruchotii TaxID=43768 RepID=A0A8B4H309_9CORY|nr:Uncharacterised protein [Corynebacterium matruchotii]